MKAMSFAFNELIHNVDFNELLFMCLFKDQQLNDKVNNLEMLNRKLR